MTTETTPNMALVDAATARVHATRALNDYRDIILYDWIEGDEHYEWVATAPVAEILDWVASVDPDESPV